MTSHRILSLISGILLAILGIYLLVNPSVNLFSLSWLLALAFLVGAVAEIVYFIRTPKELRSLWALFAAIVSLIFGLYLLSGYFLALPLVVPTVVGFWVLILGFVRLFHGFSMGGLLPDLSGLAIWTGAGMIILGVVLVLNPLLASVLVAYLVALALIYQGVVLMIDAFKR